MLPPRVEARIARSNVSVVEKIATWVHTANSMQVIQQIEAARSVAIVASGRYPIQKVIPVGIEGVAIAEINGSTFSRLKINDTPIEWASSVRNLGLVMDQTLIFREHVKSIADKMLHDYNKFVPPHKPEIKTCIKEQDSHLQTNISASGYIRRTSMGFMCTHSSLKNTGSAE